MQIELDIKIEGCEKPLRLYFKQNAFKPIEDVHGFHAMLFDAAAEIDNPDYELTLKPYDDK